MKMLLKIIGISILDFVLIWIWVRLMESGPSVGILIIFLIPIAIIVNLLIAGLLFWFMNKNSKLFLLNTIISSLIVYWLFPMKIDRRLRDQYIDYEFMVSNTTYHITFEKYPTHEFYSTFKHLINIGAGGQFKVSKAKLKTLTTIVQRTFQNPKRFVTGTLQQI